MVFKPNLLPIGIGSLPHLDPYKACKLILDNFPESPYWPQLPVRSPMEGMLLQFTEGMPGLVEEEGRIFFRRPFEPPEEWERYYEESSVDGSKYFRIGDGYASGLHAMLELLDGKSPYLIKGQVTGPITQGLGLLDESKIPAFYDPNLKEMILKILSIKARWQEEEFSRVVPRAHKLIFLDEPVLSGYGSIGMNLSKEDIIQSIRNVSSSIEGLKGIHVCGATDWSVIIESGIDVIHFDAYSFFSNMLAYSQELKDFLLNGGFLGWGIVPSDGEFLRVETLPNLLNAFYDKIEALLREGIPEGVLLKNSFISQSCGLSSVSEPLAEKAIIITKELSMELRKGILS
jgi:methionine synthase II (cobalamin-independent)